MLSKARVRELAAEGQDRARRGQEDGFLAEVGGVSVWVEVSAWKRGWLDT